MERYLKELESPRGARRRNARFAAGLAAAFLALVAIAGDGMLQERRAAEARAYVRHSVAVQEAVLELETASALMEAHHRGFLARDDAAERGRRERTYADGERTAADLLRLVSGDALQAASARRAIDAFRARHARMLTTSRIADTQGVEAARSVMPVRGIGSMDMVLANLDRMRVRQATLLSERTALAARQAAHFRTILSYGTAL